MPTLSFSQHVRITRTGEIGRDRLDAGEVPGRMQCTVFQSWELVLR
jgi:hypothetical protein